MKPFIIVLFAFLPILAIGCSDPIDTSSTPAPEPTSAQPKVTLEKFNQIKVGMTLAEVEALIGKGTEISRIELEGARNTVVYQWSDGGFASNVKGMFRNDKLVQKNSARFEIANRRAPIM